MIDSPYLVRSGKSLRLEKVPTDDTGQFKDKGAAQPVIEKNRERLSQLQEILYAQAKHAILIILQGMDTSGKDGAIEHVFSSVNPQGCSVTSFKAPSTEELAHDYLWRYHQHAPARGMITIFNRSHYESVLVERVRKIAPKAVWSGRYDHINAFERMLADEGTTILKFFLHISKDEQKRRLEARLNNSEKHWKFDPKDIEERKLWEDYQDAYEDALRYCSTEYAPWYIVPADKKWYRNWVLSDTIVRALESLKLTYPPAAPGLDRIKVV